MVVSKQLYPDVAMGLLKEEGISLKKGEVF